MKNFDAEYIAWLTGKGFEPKTRGNIAIRKSSEVRYSFMELDDFNDHREKRGRKRMTHDEYAEHKARITEQRKRRKARKAIEDAERELEQAYREDMLVGYDWTGAAIG